MKTNNHLQGEAIIGCAFNYTTEAVLPFLNSLEKAGFTGDLVLYVNNKSRIEGKAYPFNIVFINPDKELQVQRKLHSFLVRVTNKLKLKIAFQNFVFRTVMRRLKKGRNLDAWQVAYFYHFYNLMTSRFFLYYRFLKQKSYRGVLFTDVTDVIFQDSPLTPGESEQIHAFRENDSYVIGDNPNNRFWIREGFGEAVLRQIGQEPIYCAGTIIAQGKTVFTFLSDFLTTVLRFNIAPHIEGIDQGVFNYMISYLKKPYFCLHENGEHVFTMALQPAHEIIYSDGKLSMKGKDAHLPSIVHQYNRHEALTTQIQKQFA